MEVRNKMDSIEASLHAFLVAQQPEANERKSSDERMSASLRQGSSCTGIFEKYDSSRRLLHLNNGRTDVSGTTVIPLGAILTIAVSTGSSI